MKYWDFPAWRYTDKFQLFETSNILYKNILSEYCSTYAKLYIDTSVYECWYLRGDTRFVSNYHTVNNNIELVCIYEMLITPWNTFYDT